MPPTNLYTFFGHEFSFRAISKFEIRKIVLSFPSNNASGADKVSMKVIMDALPCILPTLTEIISSSLLTSVFPSIWKEAEVIALLKEGNRPVTLLPALSQICERVALDQITDYFVRYKALVKTLKWIINESFHGNIEYLYNGYTILETMDKKHLTALLLQDVSKYFDSIEHSIIFAKLRTPGISKS